MSYGKSIEFLLTDDGLRVEAARNDRQSTEEGRLWNVKLRAIDGASLLSADIERRYGDGLASISSLFNIESADDPGRARKALFAVALLGATLAQSSEHMSIIEAYSGVIPSAPHSSVLRALDGLGYRPIAVGDIRRAGTAPVALRANAGDMRRTLGPAFPVGFSLSPLETDY